MPYDPQEFAELHNYILEKELCYKNQSSGKQNFSKFSYLNSDENSIMGSLFSKKDETSTKQGSNSSLNQKKSLKIEPKKKPEKTKSAFSSPFGINLRAPPTLSVQNKIQNGICGNLKQNNTEVIHKKSTLNTITCQGIDNISRDTGANANAQNLLQLKNFTKNVKSLTNLPYEDPQEAYKNNETEIFDSNYYESYEQPNY